MRTEAETRDDATVLDHTQRAFGHLALAQLHGERPLDDIERSPRGREEELAAPLAEPEGPADASRDEEQPGPALVQPRGGHRAAQLLQRLGARAEAVDEREDRLRVDGHLRLPAL